MGRDFRWRDAFGFFEFFVLYLRLMGRDWGWDIARMKGGHSGGSLYFIYN